MSASFLCFQPIFAFCPRVLPGDPLSPGVTQGQGGDACRGCLAFFPSPCGGTGEKGRRQTADAGGEALRRLLGGWRPQALRDPEQQLRPSTPRSAISSGHFGSVCPPRLWGSWSKREASSWRPAVSGVPVLPLRIPAPASESPHFPLCSGSARAGVWEQAPLPRGPVRRGPENNGGPRPPHWLGLGWAVFPVTSSWFTSFLRKGKLDGSQRPGFQAGLSVVLALPGAGGKARWALSGRALPPGLACATGPRCPRAAGLTTPLGPPVTRCSSDRCRQDGPGGQVGPGAPWPHLGWSYHPAPGPS